MAKNNVLLWGFGIFLAIIFAFVVNLGYDVFKPLKYIDQPCEYNPVMNCPIEEPNYQFNRFLFFSILGTIIVIGSLFISILPFEVATTLSGFILMIEGLMLNWQNKQSVFILSLVLLILIILVLYRKMIKK